MDYSIIAITVLLSVILYLLCVLSHKCGDIEDLESERNILSDRNVNLRQEITKLNNKNNNLEFKLASYESDFKAQALGLSSRTVEIGTQVFIKYDPEHCDYKRLLAEQLSRELIPYMDIKVDHDFREYSHIVTGKIKVLKK